MTAAPAFPPAFLDHMRTIIDEVGWAVQGVLPEPEVHFGFAYTVGLTARSRPELWVATLDPRVAAAMLNVVAQALLEDRVHPGATLDIGWSVPVRIRGPVDRDAAEVNVARALYPPPVGVAVWQVLWPDAHGTFPDEVGYPSARMPQRVLPLVGP